MNLLDEMDAEDVVSNPQTQREMAVVALACALRRDIVASEAQLERAEEIIFDLEIACNNKDGDIKELEDKLDVAEEQLEDALEQIKKLEETI